MRPTCLLLGASSSASSGGLEALRVFVAAVIVVGFGLLATTAVFSRLQRNRFVAALIAGGLPAVATGWAIGPGGLNMVDDSTVLLLRPLLVACLGWVGVIVGMQLRASLLATVPPLLWRWALTDSILSAAVAGAGAAVVLSWWFLPGSFGLETALVPTALVGCAAMGWSPETRSMRVVLTPSTRQVAMLIQGGSGIAAVVAVAVLGVASQLIRLRPDGSPELDLRTAAVDLALTAATAAALGVAARHLLGLARRKRRALLVVFLGTVAAAAGIAVDLGFSPLLLPLLCGVMIANFGQERLASFELFIMRAEHVVALLLGLLAGVLLTPRIGLPGIGLVVAILAARILVKPVLARRTLGPLTHGDANRSPLRFAPLRQSQLSYVLAVSVVLAYDAPLTRTLLTAIVFAGVASDAVPLLLGFRRHREAAQERRVVTGAEA